MKNISQVLVFFILLFQSSKSEFQYNHWFSYNPTFLIYNDYNGLIAFQSSDSIQKVIVFSRENFVCFTTEDYQDFKYQYTKTITESLSHVHSIYYSQKKIILFPRKSEKEFGTYQFNVINNTLSYLIFYTIQTGTISSIPGILQISDGLYIFTFHVWGANCSDCGLYLVSYNAENNSNWTKKYSHIFHGKLVLTDTFNCKKIEGVNLLFCIAFYDELEPCVDDLSCIYYFILNSDINLNTQAFFEKKKTIPCFCPDLFALKSNRFLVSCLNRVLIMDASQVTTEDPAWVTSDFYTFINNPIKIYEHSFALISDELAIFGSNTQMAFIYYRSGIILFRTINTQTKNFHFSPSFNNNGITRVHIFGNFKGSSDNLRIVTFDLLICKSQTITLGTWNQPIEVRSFIETTRENSNFKMILLSASPVSGVTMEGFMSNGQYKNYDLSWTLKDPKNDADYATNISFTSFNIVDFSIKFWILTTFSVPNGQSFDFPTNKVCEVTFRRCYLSCSLCTRSGTADSHQCTECATGFYIKAEQMNTSGPYNCFEPTILGYYFANPYLWKCSNACYRCNQEGFGYSTNCLECNPGFKVLEEKKNTLPLHCMESPPTGYYDSTDYYKKCDIACIDCQAGKTSETTNCTNCASGYYYTEDKMTAPYNCLSAAPTGYYYELSWYRRCHTACETCIKGATDESTNCTKCKTSYKYIEGDTNPFNCLPTPPLGYYNDNSNGYFFPKCHSLCISCIGVSSTSTYCTKCVDNHYNTVDNPTAPFNCIHKNTPPVGYYFDQDIFRRCHADCYTCTAKGTNEYTNCTECASWKYTYEYSTAPVHCFSPTPTGYYLENDVYKQCAQECAECTQGPINGNTQCTKCAPNYGYIENSGTKTFNCWHPSPLGYYADSSSQPIVYRKCYQTCKTCVGAGSAAKTNCVECIADYYYFDTDWPEKRQCESQPPDGFYLDYNTVPKVYKKCHSSCSKCEIEGNDIRTNCVVCADQKYYYATYDPPPYHCFSPTPEKYYIEGSVYIRCHYSCNLCTSAGTDYDTNCTQCASEYYYREEWTGPSYHCTEQAPSGYYLDYDIYRKCHRLCRECEFGGTDNNTNCIQCVDGYNKVEGYLYPNHCVVNMEGYYLDGIYPDQIYKKCHELCLTCSAPGTNLDSNCDKCIPYYYFVRGSLTPKHCEINPPGTYFDDIDKVYVPCHPNCKSCDQEGTYDSTMCNECISSFYFVDYTQNCVNAPPSEYYLDQDELRYWKCNEKCQSCFARGTDDNTNCDQCKDGYFKIYNEINKPNHCTKDPIGYYKDDNIDMYVKCHSLCLSCTEPGSDNDSKCVECIYDFYKVENSGSPDHCVKDPLGYYLDISQSPKIYKKCFHLCKACSELGDSGNNKCDECIDGFYFIYNTPQQCEQNPDGYYLDPIEQMYFKCYNTCSSCSFGGEDNDHQCDSCINNHYFVQYGSPPKQCLSVAPDKYYLAPEQIYKQCHVLCKECNAGGDDSNSNCMACVDNYYFLENNTPPSHCYNNPPGYYLDTNFIPPIYKKCYASCKTCSAKGDFVVHNCVTCMHEWGYFLVHGDTLCYDSTTSQGYYLDTDVYEYFKCYVTCLACSKKYEAETDTHNCEQCINGHYFLEYTSNCIDIPPDTNYYIDSNVRYLQCHELCLTCDEAGDWVNTNCLSCISDYDFYNKYLPKQCLPKCKGYHYYDNNQEYHCLDEGVKCPLEYPYWIESNRECVNYCWPPNIYFTIHSCVEDCPYFTQLDSNWKFCQDIIEGITFTKQTSDSIEFEISISESVFKEQLKDIIDLVFGLPNDKVQDAIIKMESPDFNFTMYPVGSTEIVEKHGLPSTKNNNCIDLIREFFRIPNDEELYIVQLSDYSEKEGTKCNCQTRVYPDIDFWWYRANGEKVDTSICEDIPFTTAYYVDESLNKYLNLELAEYYLSLGINVFDPNDDFFTNRCRYFEIDGKDMTWANRLSEIYQKVTFCDPQCSWLSIDYETKRIECDCPPEPSKSTWDLIWEDNEIMNFVNVLIETTNLKLFLCYMLWEDYPYLPYNIGFITALISYFFIIAFCVLFYKSNLPKIYSDINSMIPSIPPIKHPMNKKNKNNNSIIAKNKRIVRSKKTSIQSSNNNTLGSYNKWGPEKQIIVINKDSKELENKHLYQKRPKTWVYSFQELNRMEFDEAIEQDTRSFYQTWFHVFCEKQIIFSTIFTGSIFSPMTLRALILIFTAISFFFFNALFYTEHYITQRYYSEEQGWMYILINEFNTSVFSSIVVMYIGKLLTTVTDINLKFNQISHDTDWDNNDKSRKLLILIRGIKKSIIYIYFWILLFGLIYIYFNSWFCFLYRNNQKKLATILSYNNNIQFDSSPSFIVVHSNC